MLDTRARKHVDGLVRFGVRLAARAGLSPTQVTLMALGIGLLASLLVWLHLALLALFTLWLSGYLDVVDGALARANNKTSPFGTLLDVAGDRIVEYGIILSLAFQRPKLALGALVLSAAITLSMTVFLTTGALAKKESKKSFYYQPGLMERTEGFIMLSLLIILPTYRAFLFYLFAALVLFTAIQRLVEAYGLFKEGSHEEV